MFKGLGYSLRSIAFPCVEMLTPVDAPIDPLKDLTQSEMWVMVTEMFCTLL